MKGTMKAVRPSYLHLSNILSGRVGFSSRVIGSSFSTRPECSGSTSQPDPTLFQKNSNPTRRDQSSASYVVYSVPHMWSTQCWSIQYFICSIFSASYVTYSVLHMQPIQCFICSIFSASYVVYSVLHMRSIQCFICSIFSASYVTCSMLHMWFIQCLLCDLFNASYVVHSVLHM